MKIKYVIALLGGIGISYLLSGLFPFPFNLPIILLVCFWWGTVIAKL